MLLDAALAAALAWIALGLAAVAAPQSLRLAARFAYPAGALVGLALAAVALGALGEPAAARVLPLGLPDLPFHARLDALSAFFLLLLGSVAAAVSVFYAGYARAGEATPPGLQCLAYHLFLASMALVLLADDAYFFMVAWETMALSSFFLVTSEHGSAEIRRAGYLYLLIAHLGAISILLCFGVLQAGSGDYSFEGMRNLQQPAGWASVAFLLALAGFGAKAGIVPLHVWLPEAHPAAPSPVSALMSAVMLKTAVYGMLRVTLDLIGFPLWWWGVVALAVGLASALFGVIFAAVQSDMKRLLAYSSIENIGLILAGFGLTLLFRGFGMGTLAALALTADALSQPQPCVLQEPALPRQRARCCTPRASATSTASADSSIACRGWRGRRWWARSRLPDCRRSTASSRSGCSCRPSFSRPACRRATSTCWCRWRRQRSRSRQRSRGMSW